MNSEPQSKNGARIQATNGGNELISTADTHLLIEGKAHPVVDGKNVVETKDANASVANKKNQSDRAI